ncbi:hypothetical protein WR25_05456 [Diploscapter pachys]|uniref:phosphoethanolamine N-methyltransferase n=1 Tax=Diploscapter pachys TaxID=2018661 RepID=A0A2A2KMM4_9BILA|nr:hypothetical protein WR25_05456 [Diploscapter pachys]
MPAVERQLVSALAHSLHAQNPKIVVISKNAEAIVKSLKEVYPTQVSIEAHSTLVTAESAAHADADGLIIDQAINEILENVDELEKFVKLALKLLKYNGVAIIRQDLSQSKDSKKVAKLTDLFDVYRTEIEGKTTGFAFYSTTEVEDSIHAHQNWLDFIWSLKKSEFEKVEGNTITFRDFLDKTQYTDTGIYAYEWIFGENFISPGGWDENLRVIRRFGDVKAGQLCLDIGVGIGGGARQFAKEFGARVLGVDLSANMLSVALERVQKEKDTRISYAICDALHYNFDENSFDYVFSRDCIQHIPDTAALFKRIFHILKPGGKVLITMYGVGYGTLSEKFKTYVQQRQYYLKNLKEIEQLAKSAGFTNIVTENMTERFKEILGEERARVEDNKAEFLSKFSQKEYDSLVNGWNDKLQYIADDNHNWNCFMAQKPL